MAFTYAWVSIASTQFDADSPWNETVSMAMFKDLTHLREWIGKGYYAGAVENHSHDSTDSGPIGNSAIVEIMINSNAVTNAKIGALAVHGAEINDGAVGAKETVTTLDGGTVTTGASVSWTPTGTFIALAYISGINSAGGTGTTDYYINGAWFSVKTGAAATYIHIMEFANGDYVRVVSGVNYDSTITYALLPNGA